MNMCPCGESLHYVSFQTKKQVERLIKEKGEFLVVYCEKNRYRVSRHYIALHGLKGWELEDLAARGHIQKLTPPLDGEEAVIMRK